MKKLSTLLVTAVAVALPLTSVPAAQAAPKREGTRSLAKVLTSDGNRFDKNANDFDITTEAVLAVLQAKPNSQVGVLTQGGTRLTAFVPTDRAFKRLYADLTGRWVKSERNLFGLLVRDLGVDTIEQVLLYHVVPGAKVNRRAAERADGAALTTALGPTVTVDVRRGHRVFLADQDPDDVDARIVRFDLNKGNRQIAHGVGQVLRPADL